MEWLTWFTSWCSQGTPRSREELEANTDIHFVDYGMTDDEVIETVKENDRTIFVGATARFNPNWEICALSPQSIEKFGLQPRFETRQGELKLAAQSTCYVVAQGSRGVTTGTAFFIGPSTLITVGHLAYKRGTKLVAVLPGTLSVQESAETLWNGQGNLPATFQCIVKKSLHREPPRNQDKAATTGISVLKSMPWNRSTRVATDISVLDCSHRYEAKIWLPIERKTLEKDSLVDIVGYPGFYNIFNLRKMFEGTSIDSEHERSANELLPRCELTISHGTVVESGDKPAYKLTTIGGMSGSPVVVDGKAVGVHKGGNVGTHNKCVAFDNEVVANLVESELAKAVTRKQKALGSARNHFWKFKSDHRTSSVSSVTSVATHESEAISDSSFTGNRS